ncbi:hypothetical protein Tco_0585053 [Tanacetum coccineum]
MLSFQTALIDKEPVLQMQHQVLDRFEIPLDGSVEMPGKSLGITLGKSRMIGMSSSHGVQSRLVCAVASVTMNNQRLVSEWNTNDLFVTNNDGLVIREGLSLGVDVRRHGARVFISFSFPVHVNMVLKPHYWKITLVVSQTSTLITSESSWIPSSSRCSTISGYVAKLFAVFTLDIARSIMVKIALVAQRHLMPFVLLARASIVVAFPLLLDGDYASAADTLAVVVVCSTAAAVHRGSSRNASSLAVARGSPWWLY